MGLTCMFQVFFSFPVGSFAIFSATSAGGYLSILHAPTDARSSSIAQCSRFASS